MTLNSTIRAATLTGVTGRDQSEAWADQCGELVHTIDARLRWNWRKPLPILQGRISILAFTTRKAADEKEKGQDLRPALVLLEMAGLSKGDRLGQFSA